MNSIKSAALVKVLLLIAFFLLGFYFINAQVILVREFLVVLFGNELCLGSIMASWFIGIALGAWISSRLADRLRFPEKAFLWIEMGMCIILPLQVYIIRILRQIAKVPQGETIPFFSMILSTLIIILPFSLLVGLIFPFACRILSSLRIKEAVSVGIVYLVESLGSLAGGAVFSFVLVTYFHPFKIAALLSLLLLINAGLLLLVFFRRFDIKLGILALLLIVINSFLLFSPLGNRINHNSIVSRWRSVNEKLELIYSSDSKYQHISIGLQEDQYNIFGNGTYHTSFPDEYHYANAAHFILAQHPRPRSILLVGGGMAGLIKEIAKHPIELLDYVQLDPVLITAVKKYLPKEDREILNDTRIHLHYVDGRQFIKLNREKYDLIILNLPDPSTAMINRFYTLEFFQEAKSKLKPAGVLVTQLSSTVNYVGGEIGAYTGSLYYTLNKVFPHILVVPGQVNYYFATSSTGVITSDTELLAQRFEGEGIETPYFNRYTFEYLIEPERVAFIEQSLRQMEDKELNTDNQPVTYFFNLIIWNQLTSQVQQGKMRGKAERMFITIRAMKFWWLLLPLIFLAGARLIYILFKRDIHPSTFSFNILYAIATTGFMAMAVEIILIFAFQNIYGYIYQKIGLIVAVFMFGLAIGSWLMNRSLKGSHLSLNKRRSWELWLMIFEGAILIFCLLLPKIIRLFSAAGYKLLSSEYIFMLLLFIAGIFTGLEFPLAAELYLLKKVRKVGKASGLVDGADHLGAFLGAILTGIIFAPLLGLVKTCWLLGTLKGFSLIFLLGALLTGRKH